MFQMIFNLIFIISLQSMESRVKSWAVSTESKVVQFMDEYLISYPQKNVRESTEKLLGSLFKKGNEVQKMNMIVLLRERIKGLNSMGRSSYQFLSLIANILQTVSPEAYSHEKQTVLNNILEKIKEIFNKIITHKQYNFYSLCSNMIDFGDDSKPNFKPYLLQANGCLKCFGKPEIEFEAVNIGSIKEELRAHINSVQWILKRRYEMNNLVISLAKKKFNFKNIIIYYFDELGNKNQLGKYAPSDLIPPFNITTNAIGITFEFPKIRRNHISCMICSNSQEYSTVCSSCIQKLIEMQARVKVVGGNADKISKELSESFKVLDGYRNQLQDFSKCVYEQNKVSILKSKLVQQMTSSYSNIILNLRLLRDAPEPSLNEAKQKYSSICIDCYSCHFYELEACIDFILRFIKKPFFKLELSKIIELVDIFKQIYKYNKQHSINQSISIILAELYNQLAEIDFYQQIEVNERNHEIIVELLVNLIQKLKGEQGQCDKIESIKKYIMDASISKHLSMEQKIKLFVALVLNQDQYFYLQEAEIELQKIQDVKRLSLEEYNQYKQLLNFTINNVFNYNINNIFKLFLVLIPEEEIPISNLDINDPGYLKYIKNIPPEINDQFIYSNVVMSPNPIIKLNLFKILPQIIKQLPLELSIQLIKTLTKYKPYWNTYIKETIEVFDKMLDDVQKERRLMLCLQGYESSKENLYFEHIYKILTPQRPNFIIRLQIPEKQMQKEQKNKGGPVEYIYLPIRQVKSEDLKGDTIGSLHEWITEEIKRMNQDMSFDLIVSDNIVDNLQLSLEIIYKKIVQKEAKRTIGNKTYDFFKVIYRIQGIFGEANERNCGNPRDDKLQECIIFSSHLLKRLQQTNKTGLHVLMDIIPSLEKKHESQKMIKILEIIFKNETIIKKIVDWEYGNNILNLSIKFISLNRQDIKTTNMLLEICSKIIDAANKSMVTLRKNSYLQDRMRNENEMDIEDASESQKPVKFVLEKVKQAEEAGLKDISKKLIKILPFCSKDNIQSSRYLADYFEVTKILQIKYNKKLAWFIEFIQALSESYQSFKYICKQNGATEKIVNFIIQGIFSIEKQKNKEIIEQMELSLIFLRGLIQGDQVLQQELFERKVLQEIYRIGGTGTSGLNQQLSGTLGKIPSLCFEIIKYFQQGKKISGPISVYFNDNEKRKKDQVQKQKNLKKSQIINKKKKALQKFEYLMSVQQNEAVSCLSCKEGYLKKKEVLGVYLYSSKIQIHSLQNWWKDNKKIQSITSTSYFEPIHYDCHLSAMKDDLKIQKSEWDGALIRNSEVLCNNWCGFKGPETTDDELGKVYKKYFEKNNKYQQFWVVLNDLNGLLQKFSKEYNFAIETKGSSHKHNSKLILILMAFAGFLMRHAEQLKYIHDGVAFIEENMTKKPYLINLYFCLLLFMSNASTFANTKRTFCLKLIQNIGYSNFKDIKPFYIYLALVECIIKLINRVQHNNFELIQHLNFYISKNILSLIQEFEKIADQYKNKLLKWQNLEQIKKYFEI